MPLQAAIGMLMAMATITVTPRIDTRIMATTTTPRPRLINPPMADSPCLDAGLPMEAAPAHATLPQPLAPPALGEARLRLFQLVSPALPVGAFSYSEGLEWLVQHGRLPDGAAVRAWLEAECRAGLLPIEAASLPELMDLLRRAGGDGPGACEAALAVREREGWLLAQREAPELRAQHRQMGGSLGQLLAELGWPPPVEAAPLAWTAAWAWAGVCLEIPAVELVEAYLYAWTASQLSAAVRLVPLGPTEAQRLQLALAPGLARRARQLIASDPRTLWTGGVGAGLAQLGHGELYSRLFRS